MFDDWHYNPSQTISLQVPTKTQPQVQRVITCTKNNKFQNTQKFKQNAFLIRQNKDRMQIFKVILFFKPRTLQKQANYLLAAGRVFNVSLNEQWLMFNFLNRIKDLTLILAVFEVLLRCSKFGRFRSKLWYPWFEVEHNCPIWSAENPRIAPVRIK